MPTYRVQGHSPVATQAGPENQGQKDNKEEKHDSGMKHNPSDANISETLLREENHYQVPWYMLRGKDNCCTHEATRRRGR